jgi:hypothetical protein
MGDVWGTSVTVPVTINTNYLFVIKVYISFIFYGNKKNKSWYMYFIYNQSGFDSYANLLARSLYIKVRSIWQFRNLSARSVAPRIEWMQNRNIGALSVCLEWLQCWLQSTWMGYSILTWQCSFWSLLALNNANLSEFENQI